MTIYCRWTSITDLPLTAAGEAQVSRSAVKLIGDGMLIDPVKLALVLISPMQRARKTYELMFAPATRRTLLKSKAIVTPELTEWNYGDYEGLTTKEIRELREKQGLNVKNWDHFRDGCEGGE